MSFGTRCVAPILPDFFRQYPDIAVDLHLSDEKIDLIGEGFDAALRIAVLKDSSLVAKRLATVRRFIVATPPISRGAADFWPSRTTARRSNGGVPASIMGIPRTARLGGLLAEGERGVGERLAMAIMREMFRRTSAGHSSMTRESPRPERRPNARLVDRSRHARCRLRSNSPVVRSRRTGRGA